MAPGKLTDRGGRRNQNEKIEAREEPRLRVGAMGRSKAKTTSNWAPRVNLEPKLLGTKDNRNGGHLSNSNLEPNKQRKMGAIWGPDDRRCKTFSEMKAHYQVNKDTEQISPEESQVGVETKEDAPETGRNM